MLDAPVKDQILRLLQRSDSHGLVQRQLLELHHKHSLVVERAMDRSRRREPVYWTTMLIYYIEGDHGHLMQEFLGQQRSRTVVRGTACTYQMPWEDIVQELSTNTTMYPRCQSSLKYFVRVHLTVCGVDMKKYMKEIQVRPFVLNRLIDYLIDSKHEAYLPKQAGSFLVIS